MKFIKTTELPIEALVAHPDNAKEHDESALDDSVAVNGQYRAVVVRPLSKTQWQILAGHGTTDAVRRAGNSKIRAEIIEADDDEALNVLLADNEIGRRAGYDRKKLVELLKQADGREVGFAGTGFDAGQYDDLLAQLAEAAAAPIPFTDPGVGSSGSEDGHGTTWTTPSLSDLRDRYESKGTRTVAFDLTLETFSWLVEQFEVLREARGIDNNAQLIITLVEEATGSTAPSGQPVVDAGDLAAEDEGDDEEADQGLG